MKLSDFTYELPQELIAQHPSPKRDEARLLVVDRKTGEIVHDRFFNIGRYLPPQSLVVLNNSRVVPARLWGEKKRSGGKVEIFLLKKLPQGPIFETLLRPRRRIKNGEEISFAGSSLVATIVDVDRCLVKFSRLPLAHELEKIGHMPLPPYIKRPDDAADKEFYQTVYARSAGSVAAPTAGLHFTKPLLAQLKKSGHAFAQVTLHINYATFKTVEEEDVREHKMHEESYAISSATLNAVKVARMNKQKVVAVGTTSCRVLETVAKASRHRGVTDIFIYPGYAFQWVDVLLTNFHLPQSTLLMLVYAFGGMPLMKKVYAEAIRERYRFYSYGDAMLIL